MREFIKREWPLLLLLFLSFVVAILLYPKMPAQAPIHWDAQGNVNGYGSREFGAFFLPGMNLGMYLLFLVLPRLDPRKENYAKFQGSYRIIRYAVHFLLLFVFLLTSLAALGVAVDISLWICVATTLLFIVLGSTMGKIRHNYFVGFRLPWTLANEEVWDKTHRLGGKLMIIFGVIGLIAVVVTSNEIRFVVLMTSIFLPMLVTGIYSYWYYKKISS